MCITRVICLLVSYVLFYFACKVIVFKKIFNIYENKFNDKYEWTSCFDLRSFVLQNN